MMLSLLQHGRRDMQTAWPRDGFCKGRSLSLPPGEIFAEEGVRLRRNTGSGGRVLALCEEAWVAVRLDPCTDWYAVWRSCSGGWEILSLEAGPDPAPAVEYGARQRAGH